MRKKRVLATIFATLISATALFSFSGCDLIDNLMVNYLDWSKEISKNTLRSVIMVEKMETTALVQGTTYYSQGSGMIFYENATSYYALTNNHVVYEEYKASGTPYSLSVSDCYNNAYASSVVYKDANYDLAVVVFQKSKDNKTGDPIQLHVTTLAPSNPVTGAPIGAITNPSGRHDSLTFGKVFGYESITVGGATAEQSNVTFPALVHGAYTESGSSGGGIFNRALQLVGVHYGCGTTEQGEFVAGYAIPVEKIREFLTQAEQSTGVELGV